MQKFKELFEGKRSSGDPDLFKKIEIIISDFKIYKKSGKNAKSGSNYDYIFKSSSGHYVSKNNLINLLSGKYIPTLYASKEEMLAIIKRKYPKEYKKLKDLNV